RHLSQTSGDLTKSLSPTRSRVGHHGNVHAHVAEVLGQGDTRVDGRLTSGHRHVGGVGHERSALHDTNLLSVDVHGELWELGKHLRHLVSSLTATDVDNCVTVGVLAEGLRNDL